MTVFFCLQDSFFFFEAAQASYSQNVTACPLQKLMSTQFSPMHTEGAALSFVTSYHVLEYMLYGCSTR